mmetsp:Transcript_19248/g.57149  ORF Transcript_19248/g.57149 Transcript_19248/m.57149 type:complete len:281 (+) Transcript_19248:1183-2025(+)
MLLILGKMVRHSTFATMQGSATKVFSSHLFARRSLDQWRPAKKDRPIPRHDHALVSHGRHISTASSTRAQHHSNLWDAGRRHACLVEENPPKMLSVREHVRLARQIGSATVHEINTGKPAVGSNLLQSKVLLHSDGVVGASSHCGIICHNRNQPTSNSTNARHNPSRRNKLVSVHAESCQRRELQERSARVEQEINPLSWEQLAACPVASNGLCAASLPANLDLSCQLCHHRVHELARRLEDGAARVHRAIQRAGSSSCWRGSVCSGKEMRSCRPAETQH